MDFVGTRHLVVPITIIQGVRETSLDKGTAVFQKTTFKSLVNKQMKMCKKKHASEF